MKDFRCRVRAGVYSRGIEVVTIQSQGRSIPKEGEVPRACMEALGIDCSPLDRRDERGQQGTVWIEVGQSERLKAHKHYRPTAAAERAKQATP